MHQRFRHAVRLNGLIYLRLVFGVIAQRIEHLGQRDMWQVYRDLIRGHAHAPHLDNGAHRRLGAAEPVRPPITIRWIRYRFRFDRQTWSVPCRTPAGGHLPPTVRIEHNYSRPAEVRQVAKCSRQLRGQGSGVRGQESGVRRQGSGVRGQGSGVRGQASGVRGQDVGRSHVPTSGGGVPSSRSSDQRRRRWRSQGPGR